MQWGMDQWTNTHACRFTHMIISLWAQRHIFYAAKPFPARLFHSISHCQMVSLEFGNFSSCHRARFWLLANCAAAHGESHSCAWHEWGELALSSLKLLMVRGQGLQGTGKQTCCHWSLAHGGQWRQSAGQRSVLGIVTGSSVLYMERRGSLC